MGECDNVKIVLEKVCIELTSTNFTLSGMYSWGRHEVGQKQGYNLKDSDVGTAASTCLPNENVHLGLY